MHAEKYDILVVGAGPAGASAAAEAARRKMRVLMVEQREVVGVPVQCAEYIPAPLIGELNIKKSYIVQSVRGMHTFLSNRKIKESLTPGFIINREVFDQMLADDACRNGADLMLAAKAISKNGNEVTIRRRNGPAVNIIARVIIGADGPRSTVGKWIGSVNKNLMPAVQVRVPLVRDLVFTEIYFSPEIYSGYAWLFPKGRQANLGLGMKKQGSTPPPLGRLLDQLMQQLARDGKIENKATERMSGWIPFKAVENMVSGNVILSGDAAGHTHPITGAGIFPAVTGGHMAGKWAARAVAADDPGVLGGYEEEYSDFFGESMQRADARRLLLEDKWEQLDEILKYCWVAFKEYYARSK